MPRLLEPPHATPHQGDTSPPTTRAQALDLDAQKELLARSLEANGELDQVVELLETHLRSASAPTGDAATRQQAVLCEILARVQRTRGKTTEAIDALDEIGVLWHYTSLENGLHSAYPGHGGYPESFDPRTRPWYREAISKQGPIWSVPFVDVATRQVVSSVAQAIRNPQGQLVGVTGIDVSVPRIFHGFETRVEGWGEAGEAIVVRVYEDGRLEVRGSERPGTQPQAWETTVDQGRLTEAKLVQNPRTGCLKVAFWWSNPL